MSNNQKVYHFSAPGRTELGGNHTDHQCGCVLAAAVDLQVRAEVRFNGSDVLRLRSDGFDPVEIRLSELEKRADEENTTAALVRGTAAEFAARGAFQRALSTECPTRESALCGLDIDVTSEVLPGSGLSSSAAFEVLLGRIFNELFLNGRLNPVEIAKIGQHAENEYFGKPCGLMDQLACSVGGTVAIDFADPDSPAMERLSFDPAAYGYALCILDSGADHADLTAEYAAIPEEMGKVARYFGRGVLREVDEEAFMRALKSAPMNSCDGRKTDHPAAGKGLFAKKSTELSISSTSFNLRLNCGDRAVMRAMHFFEENRRVQAQTAALKQGDYDRFLAIVRASGHSSWMLLQNVIPAGPPYRQELAFAISLAEKLLAGRGAVRVHGGGFAGTVQAWVPLDILDSFRGGIADVLGTGSCRVLRLL